MLPTFNQSNLQHKVMYILHPLCTVLVVCLIQPFSLQKNPLFRLYYTVFTLSNRIVY